MAGFPKVRMLELELFQCLNRQLGYAGRLGVVTIELPLPARGSQTVGANCDHAFWFCPFGFQSVMPTLLSSSRLWERAGITPPAHSRSNPAFLVSRFLERIDAKATRKSDFLRTRAGPSLDRIALYPKLHTLNVGVTSRTLLG